MSSKAPTRLTVALAAALALPGALGAQTVLRGRVVDAGSGRPVPGARVTVRPGRVSTLSGPDGGFRLEVADVSVRVLVESLGYAPLEEEVLAGDTLAVTVLRLEPSPISLEGLEVFAQRFREQFERRRNASRGIVFAYEPDDIRALGATNGFELFLKVVRVARPCPKRAWEYCLARGSKDIPILVCVNDRRAWGGVNELLDYEPEDLYVVEVYDHGAQIRAYTQWWVSNRLRHRLLLPAEGQC